MIKPTGDCEYRPEQAPKFIQSEKTWQKKNKNYFGFELLLTKFYSIQKCSKNNKGCTNKESKAWLKVIEKVKGDQCRDQN